MADMLSHRHRRRQYTFQANEETVEQTNGRRCCCQSINFADIHIVYAVYKNKAG